MLVSRSCYLVGTDANPLAGTTMNETGPTPSELPLYVQRQLAHQCVRCGQPAAEDSDFCQPHLDAKRASARAYQARRRDARRRSRKCVDCGKASKKRRCRSCWKKSRGVDQEFRGVVKQELWRVDPGTTWNRFRGKGRRGRLTREEQAEEDKRDARFAIAEIEKFIDSVSIVISPAVQNLPRIQRDEAKRRAAQYLGTAGRFLDELMDRYG